MQTELIMFPIHLQKVLEVIFFLPDTGLSPKIPHLELKVFVGDLLHVEAYGRNGRYHFSNLQH